MSRIVNFFLVLFFGRLRSGDQRAIFFTGYDEKITEGRWTLHWNNGTRSKRLFRFEWNVWTHFCGISLSTDREDGGLKFHFAFPPVSFWLTLPINISTEGPRWAAWNERFGGHPGSNRYNSFEFFHLAVHDWALWWTFLKFDWGWSNQMPKWMSGSFYVLDFIFGQTKYTKRDLTFHEVMIPMPEGAYPATIQFEECTWKRPRLPWNSSKGIYADIKMKIGIPHEGKGENSWDCGEDALFGMSRKASTVEEAIAATVQTALKDRRRYNGNVMAKYPAPAQVAT